MKTKLCDLIVNLKYYAKFLRTNDPNDAVRAILDPYDNEDYIQEYGQTEQQKAVEICRKQNHGGFAVLQWRKKPTVYNRNIAFTTLYREKQDIPHDLFQAVIKALDNQIDTYEEKHIYIGEFDNSKRQFSILKDAIDNRTGTKIEVFKKYAKKWGFHAADGNEPHEILRVKFNKQEQRTELKKSDKERKKEAIIKKWQQDKNNKT